MGPRMSHMFDEPNHDEDGEGLISPTPSRPSPRPPRRQPHQPRTPRGAVRPVLPGPRPPRAAQVPGVQIGDDFWGEVRAQALPWLRQQWKHQLRPLQRPQRWQRHKMAQAVTAMAAPTPSQVDSDAHAEPTIRAGCRSSLIVTYVLLLALVAALVFSVRFVRGLSGTLDPVVPGVPGSGSGSGTSAMPTATPSPAPTYTLLPAQQELAPTATPQPTATPPPKPPIFVGAVTLIYLGNDPAAGYVYVTGCGGDYYVCYCTNQLAPGGWVRVFFLASGTQNIACTVDFSKVRNFPPPYPDAIPTGSFNNGDQLSSSPGAPPPADAPSVSWQNDQPFQEQ